VQINSQTIKIIRWSLLLSAGFIVLFVGYNFPFHKADLNLIAIVFTSLFLSPFLHLQLPRTKVYLTISDALVFITLLFYGVEIGVFLAILDVAVACVVTFQRKGIAIKRETIATNIATIVIATFVTGLAAVSVFGSMADVVHSGDIVSLVFMLALMTVNQFIVNTVLIALFLSAKTGKSVGEVWNETCLNTLVIYVLNGLIAGLAVNALLQIDAVMVLVSAVIFAVVFLTYRRYLNDIKETAAKAEQAERERAEQAENHVQELRHYVAELEKSGQALRESREKFRQAAYHDALTQLPNRNLFIDTLKFLLEKSRQKPDFNFAVLFLDLNRFKTMNDSLGHSMGDRLILHVGKRLSNMLREGDLVGRFSGDEFAIILNDIANMDDVTAFAQRVAKRIAEPFTLNGRQVFTSVSIGIAHGNPKYKEAQDILRDADIAMYYAKENQENFVIFDQKMHTRAMTLLQLETDLRYAVERDELELFYQPIIGLDEVKLAGFEALVRWNHPQRGLVPPNEFIPMSEDTGLIIPITLWVLRTACLQIVEWQRRSPENESLTISVNLSGKHFAHPDLVRQIETILKEAQLKPECLKLEITESAVMENAENAIAMLKQIRDLGVQLSIDDFGTGYSSLSYLHRFPINTLKVDRSFVGSMEDGSENGEIVRTVIALAKALNLDVVAEGIETIHQLHQLRILGCEHGQGYLFSRPLPAPEIDPILEDKTRWQNILPTGNFGVIAQNREFSHLRLAK
jgi:diguanylate cyclase (GGDEF)-like protein